MKDKTLRRVNAAYKEHCKNAAIHLKANQDLGRELTSLQERAKLLLHPVQPGDPVDLKGQSLVIQIEDTERWFQNETHTAIAFGQFLEINAEATMGRIGIERGKLNKEEDNVVVENTEEDPKPKVDVSESIPESTENDFQ